MTDASSQTRVPDDSPSKPSAVKVWADVGGTFTDCFVIEASGDVSVTKTLSSGVTRATIAETRGERALVLGDDTFADLPDGFWKGAHVALVQADGSASPLGRVEDFSASEGLITVDRDFGPTHPSAPALIELDAAIEAPVLATHRLLGVPISETLPQVDVRLGTTRGTNALLTRTGAKTALLVTSGFGDVLQIGQQNRPDLFSLAIKKPSPLAHQVVEVDERLDASGKVLRPIQLDAIETSLEDLRSQGIDSLAICLLHAHVNDVHERALLKLATKLGWKNISLSSQVAPLIKLVSRSATTTLDAYLNPILDQYVKRITTQFGCDRPGSRLRLMTSGGNLVAPEAFRGRDSILSGPAGGVVALAEVAKSADVRGAIGLDMGGTSTDVSRFEGRIGRRYESTVSGVHVMTPMMDIHTVAAGGGSICSFEAGRLAVGPASAGADPGPACYGRGGPLAVTDVNLLLGRLPIDRFPFQLDQKAARSRLVEIARKQNATASDVAASHDAARVGDPNDDQLDRLAEGFLQIAITHMAEAVRTVSTAEGSDPRKMALVGFGGAAGQHLCGVASALGMSEVIDHPHAGMLSALGMGLAKIGRVVTRGLYRPFGAETIETIKQIKDELKDEAAIQLAQEQSESTPLPSPENPPSLENSSPKFAFECDLRYVGTESTLALAIDDVETLERRFHKMHEQVFGYVQSDRAVECVSVRCEATLPVDRPGSLALAEDVIHPPSTIKTYFASEWTEVPVVDRVTLDVDQPIVGPMMIVSDYSTLLVEPGWSGRVLADKSIRLQPTSDKTALGQPSVNEESNVEALVGNDPVLLEVVARRLQGIADAMGEVLRRTSVSVNVKERQDYSCAVFRGDGSLIANAPHVPVHLGAMGHTVKRMMEVYPTMSPGDCYLSNDPYSGGSHLPDITAVTPVFCDPTRKGTPDFFVASRAHHAEIGGRTPGSMPPDATCLAEEGVLIRDFALVREGQHHFDALRELLTSGDYPSRSVDENIADIAAQQAAGNDGARALVDLASKYSVNTVDLMMGRLLGLAGDAMQQWIETLTDQTMSFDDVLDDGTGIRVAITKHDGRLRIDFSGTAGVHPNGFNATRSIVTAAVLYVLRSVSKSDLPLCDGVLRDVDLVIPKGLLSPPSHPDPTKCAAVVAGNVETSQRVVDVLLGALGIAAASQGTMNNVLMGDDTFGYYETIGGGSGAVDGNAGADAVHTHMTNTRITDPEVVETRLPVRLNRFAIRRGSGGRGAYRGGDGMIREFEFLRPLHISLITNRRSVSPYGAAGGQPGARGENVLVRHNTNTVLGSFAAFEVEEGDRLVIKTPGGGGWGSDESTGTP